MTLRQPGRREVPRAFREREPGRAAGVEAAMRTRAVSTALLAIFVAGGADGRPRPKAPPSEASGGCPSFTQKNERRGRAVKLRLANRCDEALRCTITWQVTCEGDDGPTAHEESADLPARG